MKFTVVLCLNLFWISLHNAEDTSQPQDENETELPWLTNLRTHIEQYVMQYGYEDAKPHIKKLVEDTENSANVLLNVKVARNGTASIDYGPVIRSSKRKHRKNKHEWDTEPHWMTEFKEFVQNLIQSYGREMSSTMLSHIVRNLEAKNNVKIKDIDVNPDGKIFVQYDYVRKSGKREKELKVTRNMED